MSENYDEIARFHRDVWEKVVRKLLVLIAIVLELPENYLADAHAYDEESDDHLRYMIYNIRSKDEWDRAQAYTKGGHTDFGSLTLLFSQHVAGLQIRTPEGEWKYVQPVEGGITCNAADTLTFLTNGESPSYLLSPPSLPLIPLGSERVVKVSHKEFHMQLNLTLSSSFASGFIKSTVHRVVTPPADQIHIPRLGLLYFSRPGAKTPMKTVPSPLLDRLGLLSEKDKKPTTGPVVTGTEYVRARVKDVHYKTVIEKRAGTSFEYKGLKVSNYYE